MDPMLPLVSQPAEPAAAENWSYAKTANTSCEVGGRRARTVDTIKADIFTGVQSPKRSRLLDIPSPSRGMVQQRHRGLSSLIVSSVH